MAANVPKLAIPILGSTVEEVAVNIPFATEAVVDTNEPGTASQRLIYPAVQLPVYHKSTAFVPFVPPVEVSVVLVPVHIVFPADEVIPVGATETVQEGGTIVIRT